jgi:peptidoglycan/xylan/chitin deacetylase (PgdA/CDA1 family)
MTRIGIKRALKHRAAQASVLLEPFVRPAPGPVVCILAYHRVTHINAADSILDDWNVPPDVFERHVQALAAAADCVALADVPARLSDPNTLTDRPLVCLTFDDGFASMFTHVLPVLNRHTIPATAFVVTGYIGDDCPMSFDRWGGRHAAHVSADAWRPMTWGEIGGCVDSGLVTIGAHSHRHLDGRTCTAVEMYDEAVRSRRVLESRLGAPHASLYAYPYGSTRLGEVPGTYVEAVRAAGYSLAVSTDLGLATPADDLFRLPRVEATATDDAASLLAKVRGSLLPQRITDWLRRAKRSA